jgi:hypothetical protein
MGRFQKGHGHHRLHLGHREGGEGPHGRRVAKLYLPPGGRYFGSRYTGLANS